MWQAKLKDGTIFDEIYKVNGKDQERAFGNILKLNDQLDSLSILQGSRIYTVSMENGKFEVGVSGIPIEFYAINANLQKQGLTNIRPIYFVRETVEFKQLNNFDPNRKSKTKSPPATVEFTALGFQCTIDGANIKRYLAIKPDGTFIIEDK